MALIIASVMSLGIFYLLFIYSPKFRLRHDTPLGQLTSEGSVRRRHAGNLRWEDIRHSGPVFQNDILYTPKRVSALIVFSNQRHLELKPDSMIQLDEIVSDKVEITLLEGKVKSTEGVTVRSQETSKYLLSTLKGAKLMPYLSDVLPLEFRHSELSQRLRQELFEEPVLEKLSQESLGDSKALDRLPYFDIQLLRPLASEQFDVNKRPWVDVVWTPVPLKGVRYELFVSKDPDFRHQLVYTTRNNRLRVQFQEAAEFHWKVSGHRKEEKVQSGPSQIIFYAESRVNPLLSNLDMKLPGGFTIEVSDDQNFSRVLKTEFSSSPECSSQGLRRGKFYCRIRQAQAASTLRMYSFQVK